MRLKWLTNTGLNLAIGSVVMIGANGPYSSHHERAHRQLAGGNRLTVQMPVSVAYAQQVLAVTLFSKRGIPANEPPYASNGIAKPIGERVHHFPQESGHRACGE